MKKKMLAHYRPERKETKSATIGAHFYCYCPFCNTENRNSPPLVNKKMTPEYRFKIDGNGKCKHFSSAEDDGYNVYFTFDSYIVDMKIHEEEEVIIKKTKQPITVDGHYIEDVNAFLTSVVEHGYNSILDKLNGVNHSYALGSYINERGKEIIRKIAYNIYPEHEAGMIIDDILDE